MFQFLISVITEIHVCKQVQVSHRMTYSLAHMATAICLWGFAHQGIIIKFHHKSTATLSNKPDTTTP